MYDARFFLMCTPGGVVRMHSPLPREHVGWQRALEVWAQSGAFLYGTFEFDDLRLTATPMVDTEWCLVEVEVGVSTAKDKLTNRQMEIARFAVAGATAREIAGALGLSIHTVRSHLKDIYGRLEVASRVELAVAMRVAV